MTREEAIKILEQFKKCLSDVVFDEKGSEAWQMAIKALSQEPTSEMVHVETLRQVMWERDIAIEQLHELGYELGQKIEPRDDAVSRMALGRSKMCDGIDCYNCPFWVIREGQRICRISEYVKDLPSVTQKSGKWIYSDLLRVKHGTMNIDALIDKVWAKMESEE